MAKAAGDSELWLPYDFPYEFGISSPVSTEPESSDEEEDFLAGLTHRFSNSTLLHDTAAQRHVSKTRDLAGSPQSTLSGMSSWCGGSRSGNGSPNGHSRVPSDPWEVIYAAAGQVARLKMDAQVSHLHFQNNQYQVQSEQCGSVWRRQVNPKANWLVQQQLLQFQNRGIEREVGKCNRAFFYPSTQLQHQSQRLNFGGSGSRVALPGGSSVKRGCGGTGVFLPRNYDTAPSDSRNRNDCAPVMLPPDMPVYALKSSIHDFNATSQPLISKMDYDVLLARRNALMRQSLIARREEATNCEIRLPQEWTY